MFNKKPINQSIRDIGKDENGNQNGGSGYKSSFDSTKVGLEKYKVHEGRNCIDVIPFNAGPNHPLVVAGKANEGDTVYSLDYYVHKGIGPTKSDYVCQKQFGRTCPCCEESYRYYKLGGDDNKDIANNLRAKRRCIYIVHDLIDNNYYYFDTAWFSFEKGINSRADITVDETTGAPINPFDWQNGRSIVFAGVKDKFQGHDFVKVNEATFDFIKRAELSDEVLNHSVDLSLGLVMCTEEDMENAMAGKPVVNSTPAPQNTNSVQSAPVQSTPSFETMKPAETKVEPQAETVAESTPGAAGPEKTCPCGFTWGDADNHAECATCQVWDKCIDG